MDTKDIAVLTAQIVSSALQSGKMPSYKADEVCSYYKEVYACIANCIDEHNKAVMASAPKLP